MDLDLASVERELCRIPEVRAARIVADANGVPVEVHVLAAPGKHAKQVVRDVQSVAMASVGLDIDHRIVSVVQLDDPEGLNARPPTAEAAAAAPEPEAADIDEDDGRIVVDRVVTLRKGLGCTAEVVLRRGEETATGTAHGSVAASATNRLVAEATLLALRELDPSAEQASVEMATVAPLGGRIVALTSVVLVRPPNEELVTGSAPVRANGEHEALARSVLDALNRRLTALH
jgi:hypothetical protein